MIYTGVLYPDSASYDCNEVLTQMSTRFSEWAYVLHDKDVHPNGSQVRPHYHWAVRAIPLIGYSDVMFAMGLPFYYNSVEIVRSGWRTVLRYMTQVDFPNRVQYVDSLVTSSGLK